MLGGMGAAQDSRTGSKAARSDAILPLIGIFGAEISHLRDRKKSRGWDTELFRHEMLMAESCLQCASKYTPTHTSTAAVQRRRSTFSFRKIFPAMALVTNVSEAEAGATRERFR